MYLRDEIIFFSRQLREGFCIPLKLVNEDIVYRANSGSLQIDFNNIPIPLSDNDLWLAVANIHQIFNEINQFTEDTPAHTIHPDDLEDLRKSIDDYECPVILNLDKNGNIKQFDPPQIPKVLVLDGPEEETNRTEQEEQHLELYTLNNYFY